MIDGLRDLVGRLRGIGQPSRIQIVGGAAIALTLNEYRSATVDIDGPVTPPDVVLAVASTIAAERNWRGDWLNDAATQFLPSGYGRPASWVTIYDAEGVTVQVADAETLLAMKVYAAQKRGRRELEDLEVLIPAVGANGPHHSGGTRPALLKASCSALPRSREVVQAQRARYASRMT